MGFIGALTGSDARKAAREAEKSSSALQSAQLDIAQKNIQPFIQAGVAQIPELQQSASIEGLLGGQQDIRSAIPELFGGVMDARGGAARQAAELAGLSIPEETFNEISQLPPAIQDVIASDIEALLTGRKQDLLSPGTASAVNLASIGQAGAAGLTNTFGLSQRLQDEARASGTQNLASLIGGGLAFLPQGGGGIGSSQTSAGAVGQGTVLQPGFIPTGLGGAINTGL